LLYLIILAFLYKNEENQNVLHDFRPFIRIFYEESLMNASYDSITLFSELIRGNKKLLRLSSKHLYDTASKIRDDLKKYDLNHENQGMLVTGLRCIHFLIENVENETFDPLEIL
jgi:hypothetical protein